MNPVRSLYRASIGRKFVMAVTGAVLIAFVAGHLAGNLQIFGSPDRINGYAHFLQGLGPVLWIVRAILLVCVLLHIVTGIQLTLENWRARPLEYDVRHTIQATLASRTMRVTGGVILAFIAFHLAQFTVGWADAGEFKGVLPLYVMQSDFHLVGFPVVSRGIPVRDVYSMVFLGFSHPVVSLFYIAAVGLLSLHLAHGGESLFQTLGWNGGWWAGLLRRIVVLLCVLYFLGSLAIPGAILAGLAKPAPGTFAAQRVGASIHAAACARR